MAGWMTDEMYLHKQEMKALLALSSVHLFSTVY
jgi:hypothetical protein